MDRTVEKQPHRHRRCGHRRAVRRLGANQVRVCERTGRHGRRHDTTDDAEPHERARRRTWRAYRRRHAPHTPVLGSLAHTSSIAQGESTDWQPVREAVAQWRCWASWLPPRDRRNGGAARATRALLLFAVLDLPGVPECGVGAEWGGCAVAVPGPGDVSFCSLVVPGLLD